VISHPSPRPDWKSYPPRLPEPNRFASSRFKSARSRKSRCRQAGGPDPTPARTQFAQDDGINPVRTPNSHLEVLLACPGNQVGCKIIGAVPESTETLSKLGAQRLVDRQPVFSRCLPEVQLMQAIQSLQLIHRCGMIVDAEVHDHIGTAVPFLLSDNVECSRLLSTAISTCFLCRRQTREQARDEWLASGLLERLGKRVDSAAGNEDVSPRRVVRPRSSTCP
jgi:hypothetical protein